MTTSNKNIVSACKKTYEQGGFGAVCDLVNEKFGDDDRITWCHCPSCDCEAPVLDGNCLACGTTAQGEIITDDDGWKFRRLTVEQAKETFTKGGVDVYILDDDSESLIQDWAEVEETLRIYPHTIFGIDYKN